MRQSFTALVLTVATSTLLLTGCAGSNAQAQNGGSSGDAAGPNSGMRAAMTKARDDAKTAAMGDLSSDHRAQVQKIVDGVNAGTDTDFTGAVKSVDAILSPDEAKAVMGERDKMVAAIRANAPQGAQSGQGGGQRRGGGMMRSNDPGRFLLMVNLSRDRMRALREQQQQQSQ